MTVYKSNQMIMSEHFAANSHRNLSYVQVQELVDEIEQERDRQHRHEHSDYGVEFEQANDLIRDVMDVTTGVPAVAAACLLEKLTMMETDGFVNSDVGTAERMLAELRGEIDKMYGKTREIAALLTVMGG